MEGFECDHEDLELNSEAYKKPVESARMGVMCSLC